MASASSSSARAIGSIDEGGYLNGIHRRGYTHPKSLLEIVANILDALDEIDNAPSSFHPSGFFDIQRETIRILDNGVGMSEVDAVDMFALHRENNGKRKKKTSRGVSGIGAKAAICILSGKTTVHLYTHKVGHDFLHITVPWEEIFRTKTYTGMVSVDSMTEAEKKAFIRDRATRGMLYGAEAQGTTIVFQYNDKLSDVIQSNFAHICDSELTNPLDRMDFVFGKDEVDFCLDHYDADEPTSLQLYNYFAGSESNFYKGKSLDIIQMYTKGEDDRFIWCNEDEDFEIVPVGAGLSKVPVEVKKNLSGWKYVGDFEVTTGMRVDLSIFNPSNPVLHKDSQGKTMPFLAQRKVDTYCKRFLCDEDDSYGKEAEEYILYAKLVRNGQTTGLIPPELVKIGNARANGEDRCKIEYIQCEVAFSPTSTQDNPQDRAIGTQENKNQLNGSSISKRLTRLIEAIKKKKGDEVWRYMMERVRAAEPDSSDDESEAEADEEDEETDDEYAAPAPAPAPAPTPAPVPSLDQWINVTGHTDAGLAAAGGGRPVEPLDEEQDDDGHDFSLLPNSPLVPAPYPVPAIDEPSITWEDMRAELFRVANLVNRMEPNSPLMDTKWFTLLSALHDC